MRYKTDYEKQSEPGGYHGTRPGMYVPGLPGLCPLHSVGTVGTCTDIVECIVGCIMDHRYVPLRQMGGDIMKTILVFLPWVLSPPLMLLIVFAIIVLVASVILAMANFEPVWATLTVAWLLVLSAFCLIKWTIRVWIHYEDQRN